MLDPTLGYTIVCDAALLFAVAAMRKAGSLARFADTFAAYRLLPGPLAHRIAVLVPFLEFTTAAGLLYPPTRSPSVFLAAAVLLAYAMGIAVNLARGRRFACGCGPVQSEQSIAQWMVWRNLLLAGLISIAALPWSVKHLAATDLVTLGGGVAVSVILYSTFDVLVGDVWPKSRAMRRAS
jgi:hypothetical protein